jgi:hypothetical protein
MVRFGKRKTPLRAWGSDVLWCINDGGSVVDFNTPKRGKAVDLQDRALAGLVAGVFGFVLPTANKQKTQLLKWTQL